MKYEYYDPLVTHQNKFL